MKKFICLVQFICSFSTFVSAQESTHSHTLGTRLQFPNYIFDNIYDLKSVILTLNQG